MGRYSERYWDDNSSPLEEAVAAIVTAGLTTMLDDHGTRYGCKITDNETGLVGITHELRSSKTKAHADAWEDLMEKQREYYEIRAEQEKELREREFTSHGTGGEGDLIVLLIKGVVYIALFVLIVWLILVAVVIAIINIATISLIIGLTQKKAKKYLFILSLIGGIFVVADYNNGWFTKSLTSNASFLTGLIPFFFYINISAGLVASYFLVRDLFNERKPPAEAEGEFSKRNLYIMASILVIGTTTVLLQRYFDSKKSFRALSVSNNLNNQNVVVADSVKMVDTAKIATNTPIQAATNYSQNGKFTGNWFQVKIPVGFTIKPSLKETVQNAYGPYKSVFFQSPDQEVEFYVFSGYVNDDASDITLDPNTEKQTSVKVETKNNETTTWTEIKAIDNSYLRAYQDTKAQVYNVHKVIGLKYKSQRAYNRYKSIYLSFKKSYTELGGD